MGNDGSQNIFVNQAKSITIKQVNNNVSPWKLKGIYSSELKALHNIARIITCFGHKIALQFNRILNVTQNSYKTKIVNVYIVYDLDN